MRNTEICHTVVRTWKSQGLEAGNGEDQRVGWGFVELMRNDTGNYSNFTGKCYKRDWINCEEDRARGVMVLWT